MSGAIKNPFTDKIHNQIRACSRNFELPLFFLLFILTMLPYLDFGFANDDATNILLRDRINALGVSSLDYAVADQIGTFKLGRVQPIGLLVNNLAWALKPSVIEYWWFRIITNLFAICTFSLLVSLWGVPWRYALNFGFLFILFIQVRTTHEPIGNYGYLPIITGLGFLGLYYGVKGLRLFSWPFIVVASLILLMDVLYYEVSLCFFCILIAISWPHKKSYSFYYALFPLFYLAFVAWVRRHYAAEVNPMSLKNPLMFIEASLHQIGGMLPLNHALFRWPMEAQRYSAWPEISTFLFATILGLVAYPVFRYSKVRDLTIATKFKTEVLLVALGLILIPTFLIVIVERYRNGLKGGAPYLPVYLGYFGMLLLFALYKGKLTAQKQWRIFSMICSLIIGLQFWHNKAVAQIQYYVWDSFRVKLEQALRQTELNGILDLKHIYLRGDLCDWYRYPYLHFNKNSDYWFKSLFGRGPTTECLQSGEYRFPYLEMQEDRKAKKYILRWQRSSTDQSELYL